MKQTTQKKMDKNTKAKDNFRHSWLATTLKGHTAAVTGISFSPDGKKLVSVSVDRNVFLWKVGVSLNGKWHLMNTNAFGVLHREREKFEKNRSSRG